MTLNLVKLVLVWGVILFLTSFAFARPNSKVCRNRNGKFPKPGTSCKGYYDCRNYVPKEMTCPDGEHFNANKQMCDWEDLYPCLEKKKDKECLRENGLFLKPGTDCKKFYRCCNGKATVENCPSDTLFDPSKGNCEWRDLYTCIESLSTTEMVSSTVTTFETSTPPDVQKEKTSTNPSTLESTSQKTTPGNRMTYSTRDPNFERTYSEILERSTKFRTSSITSLENTEIPTTFEPKEISTPKPTTEMPTTLEPKEVSTPLSTAGITTTEEQKEISTPRITAQTTTTEEQKEISTPWITAQTTTTEEQKEISTPRITAQTTTTEEQKEISTPQPTTKTSTTKERKVSTPGPTTVIPTTLEQKEFSTPQPTTKTSTTEEPKEISTPGPTTVIPTTLEPKEISTPQPTTKTSTTEEPKEVSTPGPTTLIPTTLKPKEISTTTKISTPQPATTETSTSQPTTNKNLITSQTTGPEMSSTHSTDHTIFKENKEGEITDPTTFETTMKIIFSSSTVEATTSAELNFFCPEPTGHFPHPTNKYKFVACVNNIPYVFDCPHNLVYKHHLRRCDYE